MCAIVLLNFHLSGGKCFPFWGENASLFWASLFWEGKVFSFSVKFSLFWCKCFPFVWKVLLLFLEMFLLFCESFFTIFLMKVSIFFWCKFFPLFVVRFFSFFLEKFSPYCFGKLFLPFWVLQFSFFKKKFFFSPPLFLFPSFFV